MPAHCCTDNVYFASHAKQYGEMYLVTIDREFSDVAAPYQPYLLFMRFHKLFYVHSLNGDISNLRVLKRRRFTVVIIFTPHNWIVDTAEIVPAYAAGIMGSWYVYAGYTEEITEHGVSQHC